MAIIEKVTLNLTGTSQSINDSFDNLKSKKDEYVDVIDFILEKGKFKHNGSNDEGFMFSVRNGMEHLPDVLDDMDLLDKMLKYLRTVSRGLNIKIHASVVHWYKSYDGEKPDLLEASYTLCSENNDVQSSLSDNVELYEFLERTDDEEITIEEW